MLNNPTNTTRRVVITGLGVCAPNGVGLEAFSQALFNGVSGIRFHQRLADLNFGCQIAGQPELTDSLLAEYFTLITIKGSRSHWNYVWYDCRS